MLPVNHTAVGRRVVFRTTEGALLHGALMDRLVAFEVDDYDADERSGWSVLVRGRATIAEDVDDLDLDGVELDAWADQVERDDWVVILPDEISGRRIARRG